MERLQYFIHETQLHLQHLFIHFHLDPNTDLTYE